MRIEEALVDKEALDLSRPISLPAGSRNLEIYYTALSLLAPAKCRFKYKLEGFDPNWVDAGVRRIAYYTHLPPGQYQFRVVAYSDNQVWEQSSAALSVYQTP